jgi:hypothetical protein
MGVWCAITAIRVAVPVFRQDTITSEQYDNDTVKCTAVAMQRPYDRRIYHGRF